MHALARAMMQRTEVDERRAEVMEEAVQSPGELEVAVRGDLLQDGE
jgi:hypothetical protein